MIYSVLTKKLYYCFLYCFVRLFSGSMAVVMGGHRVFPHCPGVCLARENAVAPRYRGLGLYSACRLCGAGRQRFDKPWRFRRRLVAGLDSLDCGRRRRGGGNQDKVDVVVLRLGHRVLYRFKLHIRAEHV